MDQKIVGQRQNSATEERELFKNAFLVAPGVWRLKDIFVNMFIVLSHESGKWVLIDAGLKTSADKIKNLAREVVNGSRPDAIIMTHAHFDHRGSLKALADEWQVPVYAHHMEVPYLTNKASYPPPDSGVGGGLMSSLSFLYPQEPIDVENHIRELNEDGKIPELPEWRWIHTPGHTPGHISLYRESDGVLIVGDAFVTTKQESLISVISQKKTISGPPKYFTPDWGAAAQSVKKLADLEPNVITTGHGQSMYGIGGRKALRKLANEFYRLGMPKKGRYLSDAAEFDENGPIYIPPKKTDYAWLRIVGATAMVLVGFYLYKKNKNKSLGKSMIAGSITMLTTPLPEI